MEPDDATLVAAVRAGDREAFARLYDRYADRLHDFCWGILRDRDDAADATHDTFVRAAERLDQLRDPTKLRPWLYAIARHESFRRARLRTRQVPTAEDAEVAATDAGPEESASRAELTELVWSAAEALDERDRALLELSVRQGLDPDEVGLAIGVSAAHASVLLHRMRERVGRSLGALVLVRSGARRDCPELGRVLAGWDGRFSARLRKRVARHADGCEICGAQLRGALNPLALFGMAPALAAPAALRGRVLEDPQLVSHFARRAEGDQGPGPGGGARRGRPGGGRRSGSGSGYPPALHGRRARRRRAVAAVLALLLLGGGAAVGLGAPAGPTGEVAAVASTSTPSPAASPTQQAAAGPTGTATPTAGEATDQPRATPEATTPEQEAGGTEPPAMHSPAAGEAPPPALPAPPASTPPPTPPPGSTPRPTPPPESTPPPAPPTATPTAPPRTTQPEPVGPRLALPVDALDLGTSLERTSLEIRNAGDAPLTWTATAPAAAVSVSPGSGGLAPGQGGVVDVTVDRSGLPEGTFGFTIRVASDGGDGAVAVSGSVERPPVIGRVTVDPPVLHPARSRCPQRAQVRVGWSDESGATALLHWRGPGGSGSATMAASPREPQTAAAPLGPFATTGAVEIHVVVTDARGNAATSPTHVVPVQRCL